MEEILADTYFWLLVIISVLFIFSMVFGYLELKRLQIEGSLTSTDLLALSPVLPVILFSFLYDKIRGKKKGA